MTDKISDDLSGAIEAHLEYMDDAGMIGSHDVIPLRDAFFAWKQNGGAAQDDDTLSCLFCEKPLAEGDCHTDDNGETTCLACALDHFVALIAERDAELAALRAAQANAEPVAWRVKDFADSWYFVQTEGVARKLAGGAGNLVQPLYLHPAPLQVTEGVVEALKAADECLSTMAKMTACRSDDDFVWSAQEKVRAALTAALGAKPEVKP